MLYDFDTIISRKNHHSRKHCGCGDRFGTEDVIPMWVADMDFKAPQPVIDALSDMVNHGIYGYIKRPDSYYEAIAEWQLKRHNWKVDKNLMSHALNVVTSLSILIETHSKVGEKVLIQSPVYPQFYKTIEMNGRVVSKNKLILEDDIYKMDFVDFENKLKEGVSVFILCNPHNPVGRAWNVEELTKIGELCLKYNTLIVSDDIHCDLTLWGNKYTPIASISKEINDITVTCTSATKTFNLGGIQASTVIFPNDKLKASFDEHLLKYDIQANSAFSVVANEAVFRHGEEWLEQAVAYIENNITFTKNYLDANIPKIKSYLPEATYFLWLDFTEFNLSDEELERILLYDAKVALNECKPYDDELSGFFRINLATPKSVVEEALDRIRVAFEKY